MRAHREKMGYSQMEMAERMGISRTAYRNLEDGTTAILNNKIFTFSQVSGISVESLFEVHGENTVYLNEVANLKEQIKTITEYYEKQIESYQRNKKIDELAIQTLRDINDRLLQKLDKN